MKIKDLLCDAFERNALSGVYLHMQESYYIPTVFASAQILLNGLRAHDIPNIHMLQTSMDMAGELSLSELDALTKAHPKYKPLIVTPQEGEPIFTHPSADALENKDAAMHFALTKDPVHIWAGVQATRCFTRSVRGLFRENDEAHAIVASDGTDTDHPQDLLDLIKEDIDPAQHHRLHTATIAQILGTINIIGRGDVDIKPFSF